MEKWHYTEKGDYPKVFGDYKHQRYPQIPCLVEYKRTYCVRYWNVTEECWDDEECDDFFCDKEDVTRWMYIDPLISKE